MRIEAHCTPTGLHPINIPPVEIADIPIHHLQIGIRTCNKKYAGSRHSTWVKINGLRMFLDKPGADRKRGQLSWYSFPLSQVQGNHVKSIRNIGDLKNIRIGKTYYKGRKDDWCVSQFQIHLNNSKRFFFKRYWRYGRWVNNYRRSLHIRQDAIVNSGRYNHASLRHHVAYGHLPGFRLEKSSAPNVFLDAYMVGFIHYSNKNLKRIFYSMLGDYTHGRNNYSGMEWRLRYLVNWGKRTGKTFVLLSRKSSKRMEIDFDFKVWLPFFPDRSLDLDFDLTVTCDPYDPNKEVKMDLDDFHASVDGKIGGSRFVGIIVDALVNIEIWTRLAALTRQSLEIALADAMEEIVNAANLGNTIRFQGKCPAITVSNEGRPRKAYLELEW